MKTWIIVGTLGIALSAAGSSGAFAQAGSTSGTIGNRDKSISGGNEQPPHRPSQPRRQPKQISDLCQKIAGTWSWVAGLEAVFEAGGTCRNSASDQCKWLCSSGVVTATWASGYVDHITISRNGNSLSVTNNHGVSWTAIRK